MSEAWDRAVAQVLEAEGLLSTDPHDTGGVTKYGISQAAYPTLDIRSLTRDDAIAIYRRDYWEKTGAQVADLNPEIAIALFDAAVNSGPVTATQWLQQVLGVQADGKIGPKTRGALEKGRANLLADFLALRLWNMTTFKTFPHHGKGWFRRVSRLALRLGGGECESLRSALTSIRRQADEALG